MEKAFSCFDKLGHDFRAGGRLLSQHQVMRACRWFNFLFIGRLSLDACRNEFGIISPVIPKIHAYHAYLLTELEQYHTIATATVAQLLQANPDGVPTAIDGDSADQLWSFWRTHTLVLPHLFQAATVVALIFTSSACVERVFSLYEGSFTSQQDQALEDRREASIMIRFNTNRRAKEQ